MDILPIGTVVKLKNENNLAMILGRISSINIEGEVYYFDYTACIYPRGLVGKNIANFNQEDIEEVIFEGYVGETEIAERELITKWLTETDVKRADLELMNRIVREKMKEKAEAEGKSE